MFGSLAPYWDVTFREVTAVWEMAMVVSGMHMFARWRLDASWERARKNCIPVPGKRVLSSILVDGQIKAGV